MSGNRRGPNRVEFERTSQTGQSAQSLSVPNSCRHLISRGLIFGLHLISFGALAMQDVTHGEDSKC